MSQPLLAFLDYIATRMLLIFLGLACVECAVRTFGYQPWHSDIQAEIRAQLFESDPEIGWILRPHPNKTVRTGLNEHSETILPDRTRLVVPIPKDPLASKILILGDSSIFGWGLDDEKSFASQLALASPQSAVINAAVPGYGALQSSMWMERLFQSVKPTYVILGYTDYFIPRDIGALEWASPNAEVTIHNNFSLPYAQLTHGSIEIIQARPYFIELPGRHLLAISRIFETLLAAWPSYRRQRSQLEITQEIFRRWAYSVKVTNAVPAVMFWNKDRSKDLFADFLKNLEVKIFDCVHPDQGDPTTTLADDGHPSEVAVEYWARCVHDQML